MRPTSLTAGDLCLIAMGVLLFFPSCEGTFEGGVNASYVPPTSTPDRSRVRADVPRVAPDDQLVEAPAEDAEAGAVDEPIVEAEQPAGDSDSVPFEGPASSADDTACEVVHGAPRSVYYGTLEPTALDMSPGQVMAVGRILSSSSSCSGLLIAQRWVLTASHCTEGESRFSLSFYVGREAHRANIELPVAAIHENPWADQSLLQLSRDARELAPEIVPVPIVVETLNNSWRGRTVEAAGYGRTERGTLGTRYFTAEPLVGLAGSVLTIDGEGRRGVCFGDSGGPLMALASDGSVRVIGNLSNGDSSCVGRDNFTRVDTYRTWIEGLTGPTVVTGPASCGGLTDWGACDGNTARWCLAGEPQSVDCGACAQTCAIEADLGGVSCVDPDPPPAPDPCGGLDYAGRCNGHVAEWCDGGELRARNCADAGQVCDWAGSSLGYYCVEAARPDPCAGLDYYGRCNGAVVEWCDGGEFRSADCAARGESCRWISDRWGFYCENASNPCAMLDYAGRCAGDVAEWCDGGVFKSVDCGATGGSCGFVDDSTGYYCR